MKRTLLAIAITATITAASASPLVGIEGNSPDYNSVAGAAAGAAAGANAVNGPAVSGSTSSADAGSSQSSKNSSSDDDTNIVIHPVPAPSFADVPSYGSVNTPIVSFPIRLDSGYQMNLIRAGATMGPYAKQLSNDLYIGLVQKEIKRVTGKPAPDFDPAWTH